MSDEETPDDADDPFEVKESEDSPETTAPNTAGIGTRDEDGAGDGGDTDTADGREVELEKWEDRLDQREEGLDRRAEKLKDRAAELDDREADIEAERQELDDWRSDLEERQARLDQREQDLDDREAAIRERENELAERATELDEAEETLHNYVGNNLADVESAINQTVRDSIATAMQDIEPGKAEVDQESVDETVQSSIADAMADYRKGRFGTAGNVVFGLLGAALVGGGVSVLFLWEAQNLTALFTEAMPNYAAAAALILVGLAVNLSAAAGRL